MSAKAWRRSAVWLTLAAAVAGGLRGDTFECKLPSGRSVARVIGGRDVTHEQYPWQVAVYPGGVFCGGSLIGASWVLTAAHCVDGSRRPGMQTIAASDVRVVHGATDLRRAQAASHRRVANIYVHPGYDGDPTNGNDIALLRLSEPIAGARASYANLLPTAEAARKFVVPEACAVVTGYGATSSGGGISPVLQAAALPIVSRDACRQAYGSAISAGEVCAGLARGGKDSCQGDSGGPLVVEGLAAGGSHYVLAGVVSWGAGCAEAGKYGVYARVSHYMPWIMQTIRGR